MAARTPRTLDVDPTLELVDTLHWSLEALGAFWRLRYWAARHRVVPADDVTRANILGQPLEVAARLWAQIAPAFAALPGGGFVDPVLEAQRGRRSSGRVITVPVTSSSSADEQRDHVSRDRVVTNTAAADHQSVDQRSLELSSGDHPGDQEPDDQTDHHRDHRIAARAMIPRRSHADEYSPEFLAFFERYPRKDAKYAAWTEWQRWATSAQAVEAITAGLTRWLSSAQWRRVIREDPARLGICHARTFLHQRRWQESPIAATAVITNESSVIRLQAELEELLCAAGVRRHDQHALFSGALVIRDAASEDVRLEMANEELRGVVQRTYAPSLEATVIQKGRGRRLTVIGKAAA